MNSGPSFRHTPSRVSLMVPINCSTSLASKRRRGHRAYPGERICKTHADL
jgi:hypothetical protein